MPNLGDLRIPPREAALLTQVAGEVELVGRPPAEVLARLRAHFATFRYTRYLSGNRPSRTALEEFLLTTRAGHCEYFATATALLLREAGIPARYAVGYAVHEWSRVEGRWIVRARDAHAWVLAWIDGMWVQVDTTPSEWIAAETGPDSSWHSVSDLWEWGAFALLAVALERAAGPADRPPRLAPRAAGGGAHVAAVAAPAGRGGAGGGGGGGGAADRRRLRFLPDRAPAHASWLRSRTRRAADALARGRGGGGAGGRDDRPAAAAAGAALPPALRSVRPARGRAPAPPRGRRGVAGRSFARASFEARGSALIAASRRLAAERSAHGSVHTSRTGRRARVYFEAAPALCAASRRSSAVVMPA